MVKILPKFFCAENRIFTLLLVGIIVGATGVVPLFLPKKIKADNIQSQVIITVCGNGVIETGEVCDDGENNGKYGYCQANCLEEGVRCGDGIVQSNYEECDDGNVVSGDGCSSSCKTETSSGGGGGGGGGAVYIAPETETKVIIQGKAYPLSEITILKDGKVAVSTIADAQASFKVAITNITAGIYTFGVLGEDKKGRKSITFTFTTSVTEGTITTIGGIFIPPTIELSETNVPKGGVLNILGQTAPKSEVNIFINSSGDEIVKKVEAANDGTWFLPFDTSPLEEGSHTSRAKAVSPEGLLSTFSQLVSFSVGENISRPFFIKADLNKDGRVNLIDFSILLYWWGKINNYYDQNQDGLINLYDFSIMLYYWTG